MLFDVARHMGAVTRAVRDLEYEGAPARGVELSRSFDTTPEDLWDALTTPARLARWFSTVTGDLRLGGRYAIQGNAEGTIRECDPPEFLSLTWEFGGGVSWVEVRIAPEGSRSRMTLIHIAREDEHWDTFGPGAVGTGWDLGVLGLALHLQHPERERIDEMTFLSSPEGRSYTIGASEGWADAAIAGGEDADVARRRAAKTTAFYTGQPEGA